MSNDINRPTYQLGVIVDGISRNLEHTLKVMKEFQLTHAELQYLTMPSGKDKEVGDMTSEEIDWIKRIITAHGIQISCISRHIFSGLAVTEITLNDNAYQQQITDLKKCIQMAKMLNCQLVRIMSFRKEMILFGAQGAEEWIVANGAWDKLVTLLELPVQIAEDEDITLVIETGNGSMITSAYLARKLIDQLGSDRLKVLWDPCNSLYCTEKAYPDGYQCLRDGYLGHIHLKDARIDIARAMVEFVPFNTGDMAFYLSDLAEALKLDNYSGVISFESVYRPKPNTSFEDGFRSSIGAFQNLFATK